MADLLPSSRDPDAGDGGEPRVIGVDSDDADDLLAALQSETARDLLAALYDDPATPSELADAADTSIQNVRYHLDRLGDADLVEVADTAYSEKGREMKVYAPAAKPLVVFAGGEDDTPELQSALSRLLGALGVLGLSSLAVQRLFGPRGVGDAVDTGLSWQGGSATPSITTENPAFSGQVMNATSDHGFSGTATRTAAEATRNASYTLESATETTRTVAETARTAAETTRAAAETTTAATHATPTATTTAAHAGGVAAGGPPPGLLFFAGGLVVLLALGVARYLRAR